MQGEDCQKEVKSSFVNVHFQRKLILLQVVANLDSISLSGSRRKEAPAGRVYTGKDCEWIDMNKVRLRVLFTKLFFLVIFLQLQINSNFGCSNGYKFVIKNSRGVNRRQFLFIEEKTILAFVPRGKKFTECDAFTEVTSNVVCKVCIQFLTIFKSISEQCVMLVLLLVSLHRSNACCQN